MLWTQKLDLGQVLFQVLTQELQLNSPGISLESIALIPSKSDILIVIFDAEKRLQQITILYGSPSGAGSRFVCSDSVLISFVISESNIIFFMLPLGEVPSFAGDFSEVLNAARLNLLTVCPLNYRLPCLLPWGQTGISMEQWYIVDRL